MASKAKLKKWLEVIISAICFLLPIAFTVHWPELVRTTKFYSYYDLSHAMQTATYNPVYKLQNIVTTLQNLELIFVNGNASFVVPPTISCLFYPFAYLNFKQALYLWTFILVISALAAGFMLCRIMGLRGTKRIWIIALLGAMGPLTVSIIKGYPTPLILLAIVGLYISLKKKNFLLAGIYQGFLWLQPQLFLPLLCFELGLGQIYTVIITLLIGVIGLLLSYLIGITGRHGELIALSSLDIVMSNFTLVLSGILLVVTFLLGRKVKAKEWQLSVMFTSIVPLSLFNSSPPPFDRLLLLFPGIIFLMLMPINNWLKYLRALLIMFSLVILILPFFMMIYRQVIDAGFCNPYFWLPLIFAICALIIEKHSGGRDTEADA